MKLSNDQLRQNAAAMIAFADGKPVQVRIQAEWQDTDNPQFDCSSFAYRPKPEPVTRPWSKPEDVPGPVCWIAPVMASGHRGLETLIVNVGAYFVTILVGNSGTTWQSIDIKDLGRYVYSTDRTNWKPCTTEAP